MRPNSVVPGQKLIALILMPSCSGVADGFRGALGGQLETNGLSILLA